MDYADDYRELMAIDQEVDLTEQEWIRREFFIPMEPPETTHQQKKVRVVNGKPVLYEPAKLKAARQKLIGHLGPQAPAEPYTTGVRLITKWCFPAGNNHADGEYRITKPDTDNLQKLLKDVMTKVGFWTDDCLVASEVIEKFWAKVPGLYIAIEELPK
jgi:Holliday junction resolvase RusA-like endonuclease